MATKVTFQIKFIVIIKLNVFSQYFTSIGVFFAKSDVGVGTIVGSAVFNVLFIVAICGLCAGMVITKEFSFIKKKIGKMNNNIFYFHLISHFDDREDSNNLIEK